MKKALIIIVVLFSVFALIYLPEKYNPLYLLLLIPIIAVAVKLLNRK